VLGNPLFMSFSTHSIHINLGWGSSEAGYQPPTTCLIPTIPRFLHATMSRFEGQVPGGVLKTVVEEHQFMEGFMGLLKRR
jgi:hypothetical protein